MLPIGQLDMVQRVIFWNIRRSSNKNVGVLRESVFLLGWLWLTCIFCLGCNLSGNARHDIEMVSTARTQQDGHFCLCRYVDRKNDYRLHALSLEKSLINPFNLISQWIHSLREFIKWLDWVFLTYGFCAQRPSQLQALSPARWGASSSPLLKRVVHIHWQYAP